MEKNKKKKILGVGLIAAIVLLAFAFATSGSGGGANDQTAEGNGGEVTIAASAGNHLDAADGSPANAVYVDNDGNVGIGTTSPTAKLQVQGGKIELRSTPHFYGILSKTRGVKLTSSGELSASSYSPLWKIHIGQENTSYSPIVIPEPLLINPYGGNVGIGTTSPEHKLHVVNSESPVAGWFETTKSDGNTNALAVAADRDNTGDNKGLYIAVRNNGKGKAYSIHSHGKDAVMYHEGNVGIGTKSPEEKLTVRGNIMIESESTGMAVVELGEGLDYAEGFDVSDKTEVAPGTVLIIDPDNPGKLTISHEPYDCKVAGIVTGAKGMGSGVRLGADQFDYDVALAGQVYCNVDATEASVEPGDLLTTSVTPGYAMKATDYTRAQGAVIGKAMSSLESGQGLVLVLVSLQ